MAVSGVVSSGLSGGALLGFPRYRGSRCGSATSPSIDLLRGFPSSELGTVTGIGLSSLRISIYHIYKVISERTHPGTIQHQEDSR